MISRMFIAGSFCDDWIILLDSEEKSCQRRKNFQHLQNINILLNAVIFITKTFAVYNTRSICILYYRQMREMGQVIQKILCTHFHSLPIITRASWRRRLRLSRAHKYSTRNYTKTGLVLST